MTKTKRPPEGMKWESPPHVKPDWALVARTLRSHPMEWLKVFSHGKASWANAIMYGRVRALRPDLGFEFRTADNIRDHPRTCTLYVRFNPDLVDPISETLNGDI